MAYKLEIRPRAARALRKLPPQVARRLDAAIRSLADDPRPPGCKALVGWPGHFRVRVGDYRVIYVPRDDVLVVVVVDAGHRREVYQR